MGALITPGGRDQRDHRHTIRRRAAGRTVLDRFADTGGVSLHTALGGAARVTSVGLASPAITHAAV